MTRSVSKKDLRPLSTTRIDRRISECIKSGGVGVLRTDTIYGLIGSALSKDAVGRIYNLKRRERNKPFIVLISSLSDLGRCGIRIAPKTRKFLARLWPARVSVRLSCPAKKFTYLHRGTKTIVFRMPPNARLRKLIRTTGPLVAPSANISGMPPAKNIREARKYFSSKVDFYVDGGTITGRPSTVIGFDKSGELVIFRRGGRGGSRRCYDRVMVAEELGKVVRGEVVSDEKSLFAYSHDASIFEVKPEAVVSPLDAKDVEALVRFAKASTEKGEKVTLTGRAAGTDMSGGPLTESVVVDFMKHMNRLVSVTSQKDDKGATIGGSAVVEPGMFYRDFEKETMKQGLLMPSYPASRDLCAIGGIVSNNSGGEKTLAFGKTEDYVNRLRVVLGDGNEHEIVPLSADELEKKKSEKTFEGAIYKKMYDLLEKNYDTIHRAKPAVSKNSAGYFLWNVWDRKTFDLTKLFVGSQGTLGLVTEAEFRLIVPKKHSRMVIVFLDKIKPLSDIVNVVLKFKPESFEAYDDNTLKLAMRFALELIPRLKENIFVLAWQFLPNILAMLRIGFPKLVLLAEFTGDDERELDLKVKEVSRALAPFGLPVRRTKSEREGRTYWAIRRESFSLLRSHVKDRHTAPFIDDIIVRPEFLPEFLPKLEAILEPHAKQMTYTIAGHTGDGNFHIIPLMKIENPEARALIPKISDEVYDLVLRYKGSITAEHNDGIIRTPYLAKMYGPELVGLFEETKRIFDPLGIFNPGKKVLGTLEYAMSHIRERW